MVLVQKAFLEIEVLTRANSIEAVLTLFLEK